MAAYWEESQIYCPPGSSWSDVFGACVGLEISPPGGPLVSVPITLNGAAPIECLPPSYLDPATGECMEMGFVIDYPTPLPTPLETLIAPTDRTVPTDRGVIPSPLPLSPVIPTVPAASPAPTAAPAPRPRVLAPGTPQPPPSEGAGGFLGQCIQLGTFCLPMWVPLVGIALYVFGRKGK